MNPVGASLDARVPSAPRRRRRLLRGLVAGAALAGAATVVGPAPAARADPGDLVCAANFQLNFTPPLTATNPTADVDADAGLVDCESPSGSYPGLDSATVDASGSATSLGGVPCNLLLTAGGTGQFEWNTGQTSRFEWLVNTNPLDGTVTLSATVTSGPLAGDTVTAAPAQANPNLDCALAGLRSLTSALTVVAFG